MELYHPSAEVKLLKLFMRGSLGLQAKEYHLDLFEVKTGKKLRCIAPGDGVSCVSFSADGTQIIYLDEDRRLVIVDSATGSVLRRVADAYPKEQQPPLALGKSSDGRTVAVPACGTMRRDDFTGVRHVRIFAVASGAEVGRIRFPETESDRTGFTSVALSPDGRLIATVLPNNPGVDVWEVASGLLYHHFEGHRAPVRSVAFSPDGCTLATGGDDHVALVWDVRFPLRTIRPKADVANLWVDLASADVPKAWAALELMAAASDTTRFLRTRLTPVRSVPPEQMTRLIDGLSAPAFADRERAARAIAALCDAAEPGLERALTGPLPPEGRRRVQTLLDALRTPTLTGERLRQWRAIAILERIGTPEADAVLKDLASGVGEARLTQDAADARARIAQRGKD